MNIDPGQFSQSAYMLSSALKELEAANRGNFDDTDEPLDDALPTTRDLFSEIMAIALANLFSKLPMPSPIYDYDMVGPVIRDLDDDDADKLLERTEEWLRFEGLVRIMSGRKNQYVLTSKAIAAMGINTSDGPLGTLLERALACYDIGTVSPELRSATRRIAMDVLTAINS